MIYEARCSGCQTYSTYVSSVAERNDPRNCPGCGAVLVRVIETAPKGLVKGKFEPFRSVVDGSVITTERGLREHNARNNVVNLGEGYDEKTLLEGDFGKKPQTMDKKDLVSDIQESIHDLNQGYKPQIGADNG